MITPGRFAAVEGAANPEPDAPDPDGPSLADDEAVLARLAEELAEAMVASLGPWAERSVARIADAWRPGLAAELAPAAAEAGRAATAEVGPQLRELLAVDVADQRTGPLAVARGAVVHPTRVLHDAGVPGVVRDEFAERAFAGDSYDLSPASFADLDPALAELGLRWGAAKAHVVLRRRREGGPNAG